jgi:hypothetical protein
MKSAVTVEEITRRRGKNGVILIYGTAIREIDVR